MADQPPLSDKAGASDRTGAMVVSREPSLITNAVLDPLA
eukprot:CAMPEP_0168697170 /NCGR_PEP_ID=MMETSP0503-20121227/35747_1 /TAXON_ID=89963 /ORGANISM="Heterocapsa rotundata, Strain SCCAP K-0483" /LENGTH=38 /DNA_ID= /DNA_START= /DNA_END= /DNA_ORIENTATION=